MRIVGSVPPPGARGRQGRVEARFWGDIRVYMGIDTC